MSTSPPQIRMSKHPEYRIVAASGVFGGLHPVGGQVIFYTDRFEPTSDSMGKLSLGSVNRELQVEIHVSPAVFKSIAEWMTNHVKDFETREKQLIGAAKLGQPPDKIYQ